MQIGIIGGTGHEGRGIAARFAAAGLSVLIGSRDPGRARETVDRLHGASSTLPVEGVTNDEVAARSDVIFLAVPFDGLDELLAGLRGHLRPGSLVVDLVVPVTFEGGVPDLVSVPEGSATEFVRARLPPEVHVACALKTIPASALGKPTRHSIATSSSAATHRRCGNGQSISSAAFRHCGRSTPAVWRRRARSST